MILNVWPRTHAAIGAKLENERRRIQPRNANALKAKISIRAINGNQGEERVGVDGRHGIDLVRLAGLVVLYDAVSIDPEISLP